jgi:hypothetical protein
MGPYRSSKHMFTHHPNFSHDVPWDMVTVSKTGPMIAMGLQ